MDHPNITRGPRVFLGGTVQDSRWRDRLIPALTIDYFNPVVDDWNEEAYHREMQERLTCDFILYVLSRVDSCYSIAEAIDDSNKRPDQTIVCVLREDDGHVLSEQEYKHLSKVARLARSNGAITFDLTSIESVAAFLHNEVNHPLPKKIRGTLNG